MAGGRTEGGRANGLTWGKREADWQMGGRWATNGRMGGRVDEQGV